jgi:inorganic pyrophosphatase
MKQVPLTDLEVVDEETGQINVVIETPRGSRNKMKYDPERNLFLLHRVLPAGSVFPLDFGFVPSTAAEDGDPLDILVLMDDPIYPGNLVPARIIGAIQANQTEKGKTVRNDRLIAIAGLCPEFENVHELDDLNDNVVSQIEHFFINYNELAGRKFEPIGRADSKQARALLDEAAKRYKAQKRGR